MFLVLETDKDAIQIPVATREIVVDGGLLKNAENVATIRTVHQEKLVWIQDALIKDQLTSLAVGMALMHLTCLRGSSKSKNRLGYWEKMEKRVILFVPKHGVFATKRNKARLQLENF